MSRANNRQSRRDSRTISLFEVALSKLAKIILGLHEMFSTQLQRAPEIGLLDILRPDPESLYSSGRDKEYHRSLGGCRRFVKQNLKVNTLQWSIVYCFKSTTTCSRTSLSAPNHTNNSPQIFYIKTQFETVLSFIPITAPCLIPFIVLIINNIRFCIPCGLFMISKLELHYFNILF